MRNPPMTEQFFDSHFAFSQPRRADDMYTSPSGIIGLTRLFPSVVVAVAPAVTMERSIFTVDSYNKLL